MRIVDANVLLYAVNSSSDHHDACRRWLDGALSGRDVVGLAWVPMLAFARLATKHGLFPSPMSPDDAMAQITAWCSAPGATTVNPTARHADLLSGLLSTVGAGGNLVNDAHLAALALEHRARIVSYDNDFDRFEGVQRDVPESLLG